MKTNLHTLLATTVLLLRATALSQDGNATLIGSGTWATSGIWSSSSPGFAPMNGQNSQNWNATVNANTVAVDTAISIQNLTFGGGTINGAQTLTLNGTGSTWTGGTFSGAGITLVTSGAALGISGANTKTLNTRALTIDGLNAAATWTGTGNIDLQNAVLTVQNGGLFDLQNNQTIGDSNNSFSNGSVVVGDGGVLRKSAGTGTSTIGGNLGNGADTVTITVQSGGTVQGRTGVLSLVGGGSVAGTLEVSTGARIDLNSAFSFNGGVINGSSDASGTGAVRNNNTMTISGPTAVNGLLEMPTGTLNGSGTLTVNSGGVFNWSGGTWSGSGTTQIADGGALNISAGVTSNTRSINIAGTGTWTGTGNIDLQNAVLTVQNGGLFDMQNNQIIGDSNNSFSNGSVVVGGGGILRKSVGTGTTQIGGNLGNGSDTVNTTVSSGGLVDVQTGTLLFTGSFSNAGTADANDRTLTLAGGGSSSGNFNADASGAVRFTGGTQTLTNGASITGAGRTSVAGGRLDVASGVTVGAANFGISSGNLGGAGTLDISSTFDFSGGAMDGSGATNLLAGATASLNGATKVITSRAFNLAGTATWTGTGDINLQNAVLTVQNGGLFDMQNAQQIGDSNNGGGNGSVVVSDGGTLRKSVGTGTTQIGGNLGNGGDTVTLTVQSGGTVQGRAGVLNLTGGGTVSGTGTLEVSTGARIDLNSAFTFNGGVINGSSDGSGTGAVRNNNTITISGPTAVNGLLEMSTGTLTGAGTLTVNSGGVFNWSGGTWSGSGSVQVATGGALNISAGVTSNTRALAIDGLNAAATWTGTGNIDLQNAVLTVQNGGLFDLRNDQIIGDSNNSFSNGSVVVGGGGILRKSTGTGTSTIGGSLGNGGDTVNTTVNAEGLVDVQTGTLRFLGAFNNNGTADANDRTLLLNGGGSSSGNFNADINGANNGTVQFTGGTQTLNNGASITGAGRTSVAGGRLDVANTVTVNAANFGISSGVLGGAGTLNITGTFDFSGGAMDTAGGVTNLLAGATASLNGAGTKTITSRAFNVSGADATATWTGTGNIDLQNAVLTVQNGGLFDLQNNQTIGDSNNSFSNGSVVVGDGGVLRKSVGTSTSTIGGNLGNGADTVTLAVQSGGTVQGRNGVLSLVGGGSVAGTLEVSTGARIDLNSAFTFNGGVINGSNDGSGTGAVRNNSTMTISGPTAVNGLLEMPTGTLNGASTLTVNSGGVFNWSGGTWSGSGTTQIAPGGALNISAAVTSNTRSINIEGTGTWTGTGNINLEQGSFTVQNGGLFDIQNNQTIGDNNGNGVWGSVVVGTGGTLRKSAGTGTTTVGGNLGNGGDTATLTVQSGGTVQVQSGSLSLVSATPSQSGSTLSAGNWEVSNGAALNFSSGSSNITTIGSGASVILDGAGASFSKINTLTTNQGGFTLKNDRDFTTTGAFSNSGSVTVDGSGTALTVGSGGSAAYTQTAGETVLVGGALIDASVFNLNGGELKGTGTIASSVITSGSTTIAPGLSPGALTIDGNLTLSAGNTLAMEIGGLTQGTLYDYLDVNGTLTLAGLLDLDFIYGFENSISGSDVLTLATADSAILGAFSNISSGSRLGTNSSLHSFEVWYGAGSPFGENNLVITGAPEPSRALLLIIAMAGLLLRRRRKA